MLHEQRKQHILQHPLLSFSLRPHIFLQLCLSQVVSAIIHSSSSRDDLFAEEQRDALKTVLSTLDVDFLALSPEIVGMIPPPA